MVEPRVAQRDRELAGDGAEHQAVEGAEAVDLAADRAEHAQQLLPPRHWQVELGADRARVGIRQIARIGAHVGNVERLAMGRHPARQPSLARLPVHECQRRARPSTGAIEAQLVGLLVHQQEGDRGVAEDRGDSLGHERQQFFFAQHAGQLARDVGRSLELRHDPLELAGPFGDPHPPALS